MVVVGGVDEFLYSQSTQERLLAEYGATVQAEVVFDECFLGLARKVMVGEVVPAESGELVVLPSEAGADGGVIGDAAAEQVADERFDGVCFVEGHSGPPGIRAIFRSDT